MTFYINQPEKKTTLQHRHTLFVLFGNGVYRWLIDMEGSLISLSASFELLASLLCSKGWVSSELLASDEWIGLVTFVGDSVDVFQKNSTMMLNYCPPSVYPFVLWRTVIAKKMSPCFHLFPPKNVSLISGNGNIGLLLICILQAWKWAFKQNFRFSITGEPLCFANYYAICHLRWEWGPHVFSHVWMNLLSFARWKSICKRKKLFGVICYRPIAKLFVGLVYVRLTIRYY